VWQQAGLCRTKFSNNCSSRLNYTPARHCLSCETQMAFLLHTHVPISSVLQHHAIAVACVQVMQVLLALKSCSCVSSMLLSVHQVRFN
jgi:hypothetical protein